VSKVEPLNIDAGANYIAMCLLMPEKMVRDYVKKNKMDMTDDRHLRAMANKFAVPLGVLVLRLNKLYDLERGYFFGRT